MEKKSQLINDRSRTRLSKEMKKRIETTMIGALASVEKFFGEMWGHNLENPTNAQLRVKELYEELRSEILDKGNTQIRNAESEIFNYDVEWKKFSVNLPIRSIK